MKNIGFIIFKTLLAIVGIIVAFYIVMLLTAW